MSLGRRTIGTCAGLVVGAALLAGCQASDPSSVDPDSSDPVPEASPASSEQASSEISGDDTTGDGAQGEGTDGGDGASASGADPASSNALTVSYQGQDIDLSFPHVSCEGGDHVSTVIAKGEQGLPLVKVAFDGDFTMVKIEEGAEPYTVDSTAGISMDGDAVVFDDVEVSGATVSGELACTD